MKRYPFRFVALVLACLLAFAGVAFADEVPVADVPAGVEEPPAPVVTPTPAPETSVAPDEPTAPEAGLVSALEPLFGPYTPRTQTVTIAHADGTVETVQEPIPGLAGLDWPWLAGVALFAVVLVCLFKLVGVVAKK